MKRDPLPALLKLRRGTVDEAKQALARSLEAEAEASRSLAAAQEAIWRETQAASDLSASDGAVEAFAAWLPVGREHVGAAEEAVAAAAAETVRARAVLTQARAALRAVEELHATREATEAAARQRREQAMLDEAGLRARRVGGRPSFTSE